MVDFPAVFKLLRKIGYDSYVIIEREISGEKQIEDIKLIKKMNRFENLSENLKEIATLRLENPEASLVELGNMLKVPVGKSGVNHRLKVISQIADELRVEL